MFGRLCALDAVTPRQRHRALDQHRIAELVGPITTKLQFGVDALQPSFVDERTQQRVVTGAALVRPGDDRVDHRKPRIRPEALRGKPRPRSQATRPRAGVLESGAGNPSLAVLAKVARALGAPIDELLASPRAAVRHWPARELAARDKGRGVRIRALVPEPVPDEMIEVMDFAPGATMGGTPHLPGTREYFTCLDGKVALAVAGERFALDPGDVLAFPGNVPHSYHNLDANAPARGVSVVVFAKVGV